MKKYSIKKRLNISLKMESMESDIRWRHFTNNKSLTLNNSDFRVNKLSTNKPDGFWLSYNNAWMEWCEGAEFYTCDPDDFYSYDFTFTPDAKLLIIDSTKDLMKFVEEFQDQEFQDQEFQEHEFRKVKWNEVVGMYDGIVFLNYGQIKKDLMKNRVPLQLIIFYLGIDCSSACIFNIDILVSKTHEYMICQSFPESDEEYTQNENNDIEFVKKLFSGILNDEKVEAIVNAIKIDGFLNCFSDSLITEFLINARSLNGEESYNGVRKIKNQFYISENAIMRDIITNFKFESYSNIEL
jgi:hypothetical protein